jgi:D-alanyl-lipoteichoic acid acyltransferase DltB (MBOAT superfamily)
LLLASYFFYGWWDWRFLLLMISVSLFNYFVGIKIDKSETKNNNKGKIWLLAGLIVNIGILGVFKYYNFFVDSFIDFVALIGYNLPKSSTQIVVPVGISFYIFLSLSYILDIHKKNLSANYNIVEVLLSLSFFPIILAGPIQRPSTLLPQIVEKREFKYEQAVDGLRQILWGLFMKIAVADNLVPHTDGIFTNFSTSSGSTLLLGALFYTVQIYADFAGYSNIAIGTAKLLGFNLMQNFNYPYFSRDLTEFWKKWHISLTTWFRDYLFLPISFAVSWKIKKERVMHIKTDLFIYMVASLITWLLTGLWHGANFTYIVWGLFHGFFLIIYQWQRKPRKNLFKRINISNNNIIVVLAETFITLIIVVTAWVIFRSTSIQNSVVYLKGIFSLSVFSIPQIFPKIPIVISMVFLLIEYLQRNKFHALQIESIKHRPLRWAIYIGIIFVIFIFGGGPQKFVYFQF